MTAEECRRKITRLQKKVLADWSVPRLGDWLVDLLVGLLIGWLVDLSFS